MTVAAPSPASPDFADIVLDDISWELYEQLLREIGNRPVRVTYDNGSMELMSPLPKHERWGDWIDWLIKEMSVARSIRVAPFGSTTFKDRLKKKGLEPDKCYYILREAAVRDLEEEFDPAIYPAPDLAVEIDITSRSVPREPIYAALGVSELWRFDGRKFSILHLVNGKYVEMTSSLAFPFLPIADFVRFIFRRTENPVIVLAEFREWLKTLG